MSLASHTNGNQISPLPFKIVKEHFTYLGIVVSKNPKQTFKLNYLARTGKLKENIEHLRLLLLSMTGKMNAIKMVILPQFLYLFQNLLSKYPYLFSNFWIQLCGLIRPPVLQKHTYRSLLRQKVWGSQCSNSIIGQHILGHYPTCRGVYLVKLLM